MLVVNPCPHCGNDHAGQCPRIKSVEYADTGQIRKIEYHNQLRNPDLAIELSRCVHDLCKDVPHDIGLKLAAIVRKHVASAS